MVKLNELPLEIVDIIVRVGSDHTASPKFRYRDLRSFARISSSFQSPSQRAMSERVSLSTASAARAWIESGSRMYVTKELEFCSSLADAMGTDDLRGAIRACRPGLDKLAVRMYNDLEYSILEEPNLRDIKTLILRPPISSAPKSGWNPSFAGVTDLTITLRKDSTTSMLDVAALDTIIRTNCITSLTLSNLAGARLSQLTSQIDLLAPSLLQLRIPLPRYMDPPQAVFLQFFEASILPPVTLLARCAVLETLEIEIKSAYSVFHPILLRLPNQS